MRLKFLFPYSVILIAPTFGKYISQDKSATVTTVIVIFTILFFYKSFFQNNKILTTSKRVYPENIKYFFLVPLLIIVIITQNSFLNIETIEWDTASYLVASQEISNGNIPNETQWESKGPLFLYLYSLISELSGKNYLLFKIINDFILWIVSIILFFTSYSKNKNKNISLLTSLLFILMMSQVWAISEYSELFCLIFIGFSFYLIDKKEIQNRTFLICGFLMSMSTLINQGTVIFLIPYIILLIKEKNYRSKKIKLFLFGFLIPHIIFLYLYIQNDLFNIYFATYISIPLGYSGASYATFYELKVFIRKFFEYNVFLYLSFLLIIIFSFINTANKRKEGFLNIISKGVYLNLACCLLFYFIGSHNYYHHLIFLLYFVSILYSGFEIQLQKTFIGILIIFSSIGIISKTYENSFNNLSSIQETYNNYPLRTLAYDIDSRFDDEYTILALDYVLILYYLDKPNYSYIVHPSNHFETFITDTLYDLNLISNNHISDMINEFPDVIICNPKMIIRGEVTKIDSYNCAVDDYYKNYKKLETSKYLLDENLNYYFDPYKQINVYINEDR